MEEKLKQSIIEFTKNNKYDLDGDIVKYEGKKYFVNVQRDICDDFEKRKKDMNTYLTEQ